jgi:hypothetical protein
MTIESEIIQEIPYPEVMDWELVERWADGIPVFSDNDPDQPEWRRTPTCTIDLASEGYGTVHVKDESDQRSNPTRTIKDRPAWELSTIFRDHARGLYLLKKEGLLNGNIGSLPVPRLSYITAGNVGKAVSESFKRFGLPPMKLLVDKDMPTERLAKLRELYADIYMADLSKEELTPEDIKMLTNNDGGIDITSVAVIEPNAVFYDWHVHEAFNEGADEIYIPYGSGRLMENYLTWQCRNARCKDPRLRIPVGRLINISVLGAEPEQADSAADKLTKHYNPFILFDDHDISALQRLSFTGKNTGVNHVSEERIQQAYKLMSRYCDTEPSASAGLALYLQRWDEGKVDLDDKVLVVNTGKGI